MANILLAEDDASLREFITEVLVEHGHEVCPCSTGEEAINVLASTRFDLLITDIIMPKRNGLSVIKEVKAMYSDMKIIAMSAGGSNKAEDYLNAAQTCGVKSVIEKPITMNNLLTAVNTELGS